MAQDVNKFYKHIHIYTNSLPISFFLCEEQTISIIEYCYEYRILFLEVQSWCSIMNYTEL